MVPVNRSGPQGVSSQRAKRGWGGGEGEGGLWRQDFPRANGSTQPSSGLSGWQLLPGTGRSPVQFPSGWVLGGSQYRSLSHPSFSFSLSLKINKLVF